MARSVCRCTDKETIGWCLRDVQEEADAGRVGVDGVAFQMRLQVLELRDNIGQIYDFLAQVRIYQKTSCARSANAHEIAVLLCHVL